MSGIVMGARLDLGPKSKPPEASKKPAVPHSADVGEYEEPVQVFGRSRSEERYWKGIAEGWIDDPQKAGSSVVIVDGNVIGFVSKSDPDYPQKLSALIDGEQQKGGIEDVAIFVQYVPTREEAGA